LHGSIAAWLLQLTVVAGGVAFLMGLTVEDLRGMVSSDGADA
jgi:hypothetical protein